MTNSDSTTDSTTQYESFQSGWRHLTDPPSNLQMKCVTVTDRPDRATLYPADSTNIDRMETWLTVDTTVVCELSACR